MDYFGFSNRHLLPRISELHKLSSLIGRYIMRERTWGREANPHGQFFGPQKMQK